MLRDNLVGLIEPMLSSAGAYPLALCTARKKPSDARPPCLENPRPEGAESTLTENAASPFHAEPKHGFFSIPENQPSKREKSKGVCSRVSTRMTGGGVLSCVPPRSANTGIAGCGRVAAVSCHSRGERIKVRRVFIAFLLRRDSCQ